MIDKATIILRHRRENLKKCSLRGLETRRDMQFFTYPKHTLPPLDGYILLSLDAPELTYEDRDFGLFLIDGTWKRSKTMYDTLTKPHLFQKRSLPMHIKTAYPRRQLDCEDPDRGLASIEALFTAYFLMQKDLQGLLDHYHWKEQFLLQNSALFAT
jgi:pre-rRNA-processing protein TSR3